MKTRYFDHAATTYTKDEVLKEMLPYFKENYGNASSIYSIGRSNKKAIEKAREQVAVALGATANEIYFTSGGTESDNLAIRGVAYANCKKGKHIITSAIEHPAVLNTCKQLEKEGFRVTYLPVDGNGLVSVSDVEKAICDDTILISIMFANNEIGTIQPISEIGAVAKRHNVYFHTDAVQAIGSVEINVANMNIDLLSLSAHKFYGPKGIGAIYIRNGVKIQNLMFGGHQERGRRPSTENVPGIVGLGKAIELAVHNIPEKAKRLSILRDEYIRLVLERIPYVRVNGDRNKRLPGNANMSFSFIEGEGLLLILDAKGICASSGSACTSGSLDPSHVLLAIGIPHEIAHGSLRITMGEATTMDDVVYLVDALEESVKRLRNMSPLYEDFLKGEGKNV